MTEDTHGKLSPSRTHQTGDTDDLSFADHQVQILIHHTGMVDWMMDRPIFDFKKRFTNSGVPLGVAIGQISPNHAANDALFRDFGTTQRLDRLPVT